MKKHLAILVCLLSVAMISSAQSNDPLASKCAMTAGSNTTYLKDFRVQLGPGTKQSELRYKEVFPLSKNMKYKFTLCNAENSKGALIMRINDDTGRLVLASYDQKSGKTYPSVEFVCSKTGTYHLYFDFLNFQQGMGVGVISLIK
ncbi:MAG: hypothetical protein ABR974_11880 [Bacteroidales bacterium]|jgi:hypothetical protein